jgi:hypothetical protein
VILELLAKHYLDCFNPLMDSLALGRRFLS